MSVDELVEKTARAIAGHFGPAYDDLLPSRLEVRKSGQPNDNDQDGVREAARSAILAVLEGIRDVRGVSAAMREASLGPPYRPTPGEGIGLMQANILYQAAIDALRASVEKEDV